MQRAEGSGASVSGCFLFLYVQNLDRGFSPVLVLSHPDQSILRAPLSQVTRPSSLAAAAACLLATVLCPRTRTLSLALNLCLRARLKRRGQHGHRRAKQCQKGQGTSSSKPPELRLSARREPQAHARKFTRGTRPPRSLPSLFGRDAAKTSGSVGDLRKREDFRRFADRSGQLNTRRT